MDGGEEGAYVTLWFHKTVVGESRLCMRFSNKPSGATLTAIKDAGGRYRRGTANARPCWYLAFSGVHSLYQKSAATDPVLHDELGTFLRRSVGEETMRELGMVTEDPPPPRGLADAGGMRRCCWATWGVSDV